MAHPMPIDKKFSIRVDNRVWEVSRRLIPKESCHYSMGLDRFYCVCQELGKIVVSHHSSMWRHESTPENVATRAQDFLDRRNY